MFFLESEEMSHHEKQENVEVEIQGTNTGRILGIISLIGDHDDGDHKKSNIMQPPVYFSDTANVRMKAGVGAK